MYYYIVFLKSILNNCFAIALVAFVTLCVLFKHLKASFKKWFIDERVGAERER